MTVLPQGKSSPRLALNASMTQAMASELADDTVVTHLTLYNKKCGIQGAKAVGLALATNSTLKFLSMQCQNVKPTGFVALCAGLERNRGLLLLDLGGNDLGDKDEVGVALGRALTTNRSLKSLGLQLCKLGEKATKMIANALNVNNTLECLNLYSDPIGSEGAIALAHSLEINTSLRHLSLGGYSHSSALGDDALRALAEALSKNQGLLTINFNECTIGDNAGETFAQALEKNKTLCTLDMRSTGIGSRSCAAFAKAMEANTTLTTLRLGDNGLTEADLAPIQAACQRNVASRNTAKAAGLPVRHDPFTSNPGFLNAYPLLRYHLDLPPVPPVPPLPPQASLAPERPGPKPGAKKAQAQAHPPTKRPRPMAAETCPGAKKAQAKAQPPTKRSRSKK